MKENKFRIWIEERKQFLYFDLNCLEILTSDEIDLIGRYKKEQYIEKLDQNKQEIYEYDTIEGELFNQNLPTRGTIIFDKNTGCYVSSNFGGNTPIFKIDKIKVIGHVHENEEKTT